MEWMQLVGSVALLFLVVGLCIRWALRNGLNERLRPGSKEGSEHR